MFRRVRVTALATDGSRDRSVALNTFSGDDPRRPMSQRRATGDAESTRETFELVGLILVLWCIGFVAALAAVEAVS